MTKRKDSQPLESRMDLRRSDMDNLVNLASVWKTTPGAELEAALVDLDLTGWQDVISHLRSLGMREAPQLTKLNICLSNDLRITLEGAGVIQAYCRDNSLKGKPFTAMVKEPVGDTAPVALGGYAVKAKLKREIPLAADDKRVKEVLGRWDTLAKHFRLIQRFEFSAPAGIPVRFDVSIVRENTGGTARTFQESRVAIAPPRYEAEAEITARREDIAPDMVIKHLVNRGVCWLLQGRQRSFVLVSATGAESVRDSLAEIFPGRRGAASRKEFRYPGPQPATLERVNIVLPAEPGVANLLTAVGGYNVTDKADGLRCLATVTRNGRIFLVDGGGRVYATGKEVADKSMAGVVIDGEWIRSDKLGKTVSHFYAFDILADAGGNTDVTTMPFAIVGALLGSAAAAATRQNRMAVAVAALAAATQTVKSIPASQNIQFGVKSFRVAEGIAVLREAAAAVLEDAKSAPYNTDGLIFTPNAARLPLGTGTWAEQLKWKPAKDNTIDFLVIAERAVENGKPSALDAVGNKYREDAGQTVRFKTLRLFVGSNKAAAFQDPRRAVVSGEELPTAMASDDGEWREVEFRPTDPRDPMASVCYVAIGEGGMDSDGDLIRAANGDVIQSDMIVEMAYHADRAPGWRWVPQRVRHDKTERWLAGRRSGTMNADWVAASIWKSIHNPVTEEAVRTGKVEYCPAGPVAAAGGVLRRGPGRDLMRVQCMTNFHDDWIKRRMLLRPLSSGSKSIADLACGNGNDLHMWISAGVNRAFGCDVLSAAINDPSDGAYSRLMSKIIRMGGRDRVPPIHFAVADAARRLCGPSADAGATPEDTEVLRAVLPPATEPFDCVSCMFGVHGMFRDSNTLAGFLTNLADLVKVGGYFVGCCLDGDVVARNLQTSVGSVVGADGPAEIWTITRRYGTAIGSIVPPSEAGLGLAFDLDFTAAGWSHQEYLVSWPYFQARLAECGLELLTADEVTAMELPGGASTGLFSGAWDAAAAAGENYGMTDAVRRLSFMHRWWIMRRRSDRRPAAPLEVVAAPAALTVQRTATREPEALPLPLPAPPSAPALSAIPEETATASASASASASATAAAAVPPEPPFVINSTSKEPNLRLGAEFADWPRYLTPGQLIELTDITNPGISYPSAEAALASAKFQKATDKPELGPQLFRVEGAIHQKFARERAKGGSAEIMAKLMDDEVSAIRVASGKAKIKAYKATWSQEAWDTTKAEVYRGYFRQRYDKDARFREILQMIKARGGEILFANGTEPSELGVGVLADGTVVGGDNKVGKWLMELAA